MKGSENATMRQSFTRMCYGERFPLYIKDAKPKPQAKPVKKIGDSTDKKLERIIFLLTQLLAGEQKARDKERQRRFNQMCNEAQQGYRSRNPHTWRDQNRLSIPIENCDQRPAAVGDRAMSSYDRACLESQSAYAARNPHKRG